MVSAIRHDPFALFGFALRESDWVLADLLAQRLAGRNGSVARVVRELESRAGRPGQPGSLPELHRLAQLTRKLELMENGG